MTSASPAGQGGGAPLSPIDPHILDEAAHWLMSLSAGDATDADRAACEQWCSTSSEHARAWARAELLMNKLGGLPASLAMPALDRPADAVRRRLLARGSKLAALLALVPAGWAAWRVSDERGWTADHHTAVGERREVQLADGSRITINTTSAIDVRFGAAERLVVLRAGEMLVQTGHDTAEASSPAHRAFRVGTNEGRLEALGTRFTVRQTDGRTFVAVLDGAVRIEPLHGHAALVLQAGQKTSFTLTAIAPIELADEAVTAWTQGMLLADRMRLADVAAELARYRHGIVRCDPSVADLRVSGAFPVGSAAESDRSLTMLVSTYPVEAHLRFHGLWVTLVPR